MAKYLFGYHGGRMAESEEEQQKVMAAWGEWFQTLGAAVIDGGAPIAARRTVGGSGSDGDPLTGYSVIAADSLDDAAAKAGGCPILADGGSVEVAELHEM